MANAAVALYNFYFRYKWSDVDFTAWQSGLVDTVHGAMEGGFGASVVQGGAITPGAGLTINVANFIAVGPTGYLHVLNTPAVVNISAANVTNPRRDLIVARPNSVGASAITRPTIPFDTVNLQQLQETQIVVIAGTAAASPVYPAAGSDDVVLAGLRVAPSAASFAQTDIDMFVRDIAGKHTNFQQQQSKYDDRCRPYASSSNTLGIKPSQLFEANGQGRAFTYVASSVASRFPQSSANVISSSDATLNFQTGVVAGGDNITPDFTPQIPTAGNCIVAAVALNANDTLNIQFGVVGTRAQCFAAIYNQTQGGGAGSIVAPTNSYPIAYVVLSSKDGSTITELDVMDARTPFAFIGSPQLRRYPNVILAGDGTGDYTTLASAIAALPSGGLIVLGSNTTVTVSTQIPANTKLIGRQNLTLTINAGVVVGCGANVLLEDLIIDHTGASSGNAILASGVAFKAYNVTCLENATGTGVAINITAGRASVEDCSFYGCVDPSTATGISIGTNAFDYYLNNNTFSR